MVEYTLSVDFEYSPIGVIKKWTFSISHLCRHVFPLIWRLVDSDDRDPDDW